MEEKIAAAGPQILGLSYLDSGDGMRKLKIVDTFSGKALYSVTLKGADGISKVLKNMDPDPYFEISQEEHGTLLIQAEDITAEIGV